MKKKILAYIKVCGVIAVMAKFTSSFLSSWVLQRAGQLIFFVWCATQAWLVGISKMSYLYKDRIEKWAELKN